jgi:hypothetical protein
MMHKNLPKEHMEPKWEGWPTVKEKTVPYYLIGLQCMFYFPLLFLQIQWGLSRDGELVTKYSQKPNY